MHGLASLTQKWLYVVSLSNECLIYFKEEDDDGDRETRGKRTSQAVGKQNLTNWRQLEIRLIVRHRRRRRRRRKKNGNEEADRQRENETLTSL